MKPPSPEEVAKKTDYEQVQGRVIQILQESDALSLPPKEQVEKIIAYVQEAEKDRPAATDVQDLERLYSELRDYSGNDVASFTADRLLKLLEHEGKYSDKRGFQERLAGRQYEKKGWKIFPGNYVFTYGVVPEEGMVHIHLMNPYRESEKQETGALGAYAFRMFLKGLGQFAREVVEPDEGIKTITATSALLARQELASFLENLGFVNQGEIDDELRQAHFSEDKSVVIRMTADRVAFLEKMKNADLRSLQKQFIESLRSVSGTK